MTVPPHQPPPGSPGPYGQQPHWGPPQAQQPPHGQPPGQQPPYGSPPYGGPQYGGPQYGGPQYGLAPHPPQPGFGPPPGGQPPKKNRLLWLKIGLPIALVVVAGLATLVVVVVVQSSAANAEVGDCLDVPEFSATPSDRPRVLDCANEAATVKVAVVVDDQNAPCPQGDYDHISFDGGDTLCLMINAKVGDCFADVTSATEGYRRVSCTDTSAEVEFLKVVKGGGDPRQACAGTGATFPVVYSEPPTILCAREPKVA